MIAPAQTRLRPLAAVAIVVIALLGACSGSSPKSSSTKPTTSTGTGTSTTVVATGTAVPASASAGCNKPPEAKVQGRTGNDPDVLETITSSGDARTYRLEVPKGDPNTKPHPLILNLHGSGSNAVQQSVYSRYPQVAGDKGYIVITPDAIANNWGLFSPTDTKAKDLIFAKDLLDSIEGRFCVDTNRVYASGISLGAAFSADLACAMPNRIAAIGLVAVEVQFTPCPRTVPLLVFHGTADPVVPYGAGQITESKFRGANSPGTAANMVKWATLDKCQPQPIVTNPSSEVRLSVWNGCAGGSEVKLYTIVGGGHTWPGSPIKIDRLGYTTEQVDATALILDLFARHPLAGAH